MKMTWDYFAGFFDGEGSVGEHAITCSNTNQASIVAIHEFLECGHVRLRKIAKPGLVVARLPLYDLVVSKHVDLERILLDLTPRCLIKRERLEALSERLLGTSPRRNYGLVSAFGADKIRHLYESERKSGRAIADIIGVDTTAVHAFMSRNGIERRQKSEASRLRYHRQREQDGITPEKIIKMYVDKQISLPDIAKTFGCSLTRIVGVMRTHGIPRRTRSEATALRVRRYETGELVHWRHRPKA